MRILLAPGGSRGDVQPQLALGVRLAARGHRVSVAAAPNFRVWVEGHGLAFHTFGPDVEALSREMGEALRNPLTFAHVGLTVLRQQFTDLEAAAARGVDVIAGAGAQGAGGSVAAALGVPYFYTAYCPQVLPSYAHAPMTIPFLQDLPRAANVLPWKATTGLANVFGLGPLNRERKRLGVPPARDMYRAILDGAGVFVACDEMLAPVPDDSGFSLVRTGPWFLDDNASLPDDVERFLSKPGAPVVYAGFGSMVTSDADALTALVVDAAERAGVRVLLSAGWARIGGGALPTHAHAAGALPHAALLPRVAAAVHHGGAGTTHAALRAGIPQVLVPHLLDQFYWARRVPALGVGVGSAPMSRLTASRLAAAIRAALAPDVVACARAHAPRVRAADGVEAAASHLERTVAEPPVAQRHA